MFVWAVAHAGIFKLTNLLLSRHYISSRTRGLVGAAQRFKNLADTLVAGPRLQRAAQYVNHTGRIAIATGVKGNRVLHRAAMKDMLPRMMLGPGSFLD